jgi:hypothetical protein
MVLYKKIENYCDAHRGKYNRIRNNPWICLWFFGLLEYLSLFGLAVLFGNILFGSLGPVLYSTSAFRENALYLMSAMVTAQATIIALVVSLNLVAIQMSATSYSPRIVDGIRKNPDMWILLGVYLLAISYGFHLIKSLSDAPVDQNSAAWCLILGIYTFLILVVYLWNTIDLLRPDEAVSMLVRDVHAKNFHKKDEEEINKIMEPVFDVVHASVNRFDATTTRVGLKKLSIRLVDLFPTLDQNAISVTTDRFCVNVIRTTRIVIKKDDEFLLQEIITILKEMDKDIIKKATDEKWLEDPAKKVTEALRDIGKYAAEKGLENAFSIVVDALQDVGMYAADKKLNDTTYSVADALRDVGKHAVDMGLEKTTHSVAVALMNVGYQSIKNKDLEIATESVANALGDLGAHVADRGQDLSTKDVIEQLHVLGNLAIKKRQETAASSVANALWRVGKHAVNNDLKVSIKHVIKAIRDMGAHSGKEGLNNTTLAVKDALMHLLNRLSENQYN